MITVYTKNIREELDLLTGEQRQHLLSLLCVIRRKQAERIKLSSKQDREILAGVFLQEVLYQRCAPAEPFAQWCGKLRYEKTEDGKPYLPDYPKLQFNLSHTGDWVAVAVGDEQVGIDVETLAPEDKCLSIAKRFFHPREYADLAACAPVELSRQFTMYWTCKEAYVKYLGTGLKTPLNSFLVRLDERTIAQQHVNLHMELLGNDTMMAVCTRDGKVEYSV